MLWPFFAGSVRRAVSRPTSSPCPGIGASGREPTSATVGARIACPSSYYRFLVRMGLVRANPCDRRATTKRRTGSRLGRRRGPPAPSGRARHGRGTTDRAFLLMFVLTGRRRAEVLGLTAGDLSVEGETVFYAYRGKGGKRGRRELPRPAYEAICRTLADAGLVPRRCPAPRSGRPGPDHRVSSGAVYARFRRYRRLPVSPRRAPHPAAHRGQAPARRRRVDRGGQLVPGPLEPGGDHGLSPPARGRDRRALGRRRGSDRS